MQFRVGGGGDSRGQPYVTVNYYYKPNISTRIFTLTFIETVSIKSNKLTK